jgi:hypothetical protein
VQRVSERLGLSPSALRRDLVRKQERPAQPAMTEAPPAPVKHPDEEMALIQLFFLHPAEVMPIVADHLPPAHLTDSDCRLLLELMLEDPAALPDSIPDDRPEAQRLAVRIQMDDTKLRGADISPAKAAQDLVMALWRQALILRRRGLIAGGKIESSGEITAQLQCLKKGWEHAVNFLVA